jgi:glycosyltransferase involved in cell wall biosynthesis
VLAKLPGVVVTGTVDDVRPYYRGALATVVPLRVGSGTRLKILEAMASGVPVVSTLLGAEGLEVTDGSDILLAETPAETLAAIEALADSAERWRSIVAAGRELVRTRYDWPILGEKLFRIHCAARERAA